MTRVEKAYEELNGKPAPTETVIPHEFCYTTILGNKPGERVGIVKLNDSGYYPCEGWDYPGHNIEEVKAHVASLNERLGIPQEIADSMSYGSLFGWHVPAAAPARRYFEAKRAAQEPAAQPMTVQEIAADPTRISTEFLIAVAAGRYSDAVIVAHIRDVAEHWTTEALAARIARNNAAHDRREG